MTFGAQLSTPDHPSYIFLISFVFLNSLLFCLISTVLWGSATSICDGIIEIPIVHWRCKFRFSEKILPWLGLGWEIYSLCSQIQSLSCHLLQKQRGITQVKTSNHRQIYKTQNTCFLFFFPHASSLGLSFEYGKGQLCS